MRSNIIAKNEVKILTRERSVLLFLIIFILLVLSSAFIGFFAQHTIQKVFKVAATELQNEGQSVPPSPFTNFPDLSVVKNMIIYIVLCGALFAIVLGYSSGIQDKKSGTVKMLFSHQVNKKDFFIGKVKGISFILMLIMLVSLLISALSSAFLSHLTGIDILRLFGFYALSFIYLLGFAILGIAFALIIDNDAVALIIPLLIWVVITFVIPGFASALYPTATLNPVLSQNVTPSPALDFMHSISSPFSISEHFKDSGTYILNLKNPFTSLISSGTNIINVNLIIMWLLICILIGIIVIRKFNVVGDSNG